MTALGSQFLGGRFSLTPRPTVAPSPALEVAMLGHCPGPVAVARLQKLPGLLAQVEQLGFGARLGRQLAQAEPRIAHVPLPLNSMAEFDDIFPEARQVATGHRSLLAGSRAWLPQAVADFFANGGEKLWLVPVPEEEGQAGFFVPEYAVLHDIDSLRGLAVVLALQDVGLVALPDLERLQIPAQLPDVPRLRLDNPAPRFLPVSQQGDDDHRERRYPSEIPEFDPPLAFTELLRGLLEPICRYRPDLQCLLSLPLAYAPERDSPTVDPAALDVLKALRLTEAGKPLRHIQFLFPYLRGPRYDLYSTVGGVAGLQAASSRRRGSWRSTAGLPLLSDGRPYPVASHQEAVALRTSPGIGVLKYHQGQIKLDDERLVMPVLHAGDYTAGATALDGYCAGEVARFLGDLMRRLQRLGESLVFNLDSSDPRPLLALEKFFTHLFEQGALRGRLPEQAFRIRQRPAPEGVAAFEIQLAPAFPIDHIALTFVSRNGAWQAEVANA